MLSITNNRQFRTVAVAALLAALLVVCTLFTGGCAEQLESEAIPGLVTRADIPSSVDGTGIPCSIYLPSDYDAARTYPVWVELHALYAYPVLDNDASNPISNTFKTMADNRKMIIVAPWGRTLHGQWIDGLVSGEPDLFEDFSSATNWSPRSGNWGLSSGSYRQSSEARTWNESTLNGSTGTNYGVRCKVRDFSDSGEELMGIRLKTQPNGDGYLVFLRRDAKGTKYVGMSRRKNGTDSLLYELEYDWKAANSTDRWVGLKASCYRNYLEVYVNENIVSIQPLLDSTPYGYGMEITEDPIDSGQVSLVSFGAVHEFDEVRVQNEYAFGEQDVLDCVDYALERFNVDPLKVYVAGHSMGGLGSFVAALHNPDRFAAIRSAGGLTNLSYDYRWMVDHYPKNPPGNFARVNDGRMAEYLANIANNSTNPADAETASVWNQNSAYSLLENAVNTDLRIQHGKIDANVPNTYDPLGIGWYRSFGLLWIQVGAPAPYAPGIATYRNGQDIVDLLDSWGDTGRYRHSYVTNDFAGHGYLESYETTADYFLARSLDRTPPEVAYKTFNNSDNGAWWLRIQIPRPNTNQPGMARVSLGKAGENMAAIHARNLTSLSLDLQRMGISNEQGKTLSFSIDDDTSPNVTTITDTTGKVDLNLNGIWRGDPSKYTVLLNGAPFPFSLAPNRMTIPGVPTSGGRRSLTVTVASSLPANLVSNPGIETLSGGSPAGWTSSGTGSAGFSVDPDQFNTGIRSLRIRNAQLNNGSAAWNSAAISTSPGRRYNLVASVKARLLRCDYAGIGLQWYNSAGNLIGTTWSSSVLSSNASTTAEWEQVHVAGTAPSGAASVKVVAGLNGNSPSDGKTNGSVWFDDFSLSTF